jgi:hypothetical protein
MNWIINPFNDSDNNMRRLLFNIARLHILATQCSL